MNRRGFVFAILGAAAGLALAHRDAMALPVAQPQPAEPELQPDKGVLSEDDQAPAVIEQARLRRHRRVIIRRRVIVSPRRHYGWYRGRHRGWYRPRRRRVYYY